MIEPESLLQEAIAALNESDYATAGERFERAAELLAVRRPDDAVAAFESATRLALMRGDVATAAATLDRARALGGDNARILRLAAEVADVDPDINVRRAAWQAVARSGDATQRHQALLRLADLSRNQKEHAQSAVYFSEVVRNLPQETAPHVRAELYLEIASARTATGELDIALAALDDADQLLPATGDDKTETLRNRIAGQRAVIAFGSGDPEGALRAANAVRDRAVQTDDVMTYLGAAALIAMVHEQEKRLVDAYDTYIRARESLAQLLGEDGKRLVSPAIEMFEARLGPDEFAVVWNEWVARRRAALAPR
ncbi:MAG TPA: hypothetical protein VGM90_10355 [Kofleriaceae bacterium]|jgi:tetratricopeptide (TPR) repeat protein